MMLVKSAHRRWQQQQLRQPRRQRATLPERANVKNVANVSACSCERDFLHIVFCLILVLLFGLTGCDVRATVPQGSAGALSGEGFSVLQDYSPITERIAKEMPAPAAARPDVGPKTTTGATGDATAGTATTGEDAATDAATTGAGAATGAATTAEDTTPSESEAASEDAGYANADSANQTVAINRNKVAGLSALPLEVTTSAGYTYAAKGEYLSVTHEQSGAKTQEINLYDCVAAGGQALAVQYEGQSKTLAVLYAANAGAWKASSDLALAAYAAPKTLVLFFDASEPASLTYLDAQGITGTPKAVSVKGEGLVLVTEHACVPGTDAAGNWLTSGVEPETLEAYKTSLELRKDDPVAFAPSFYRDGELYALSPSQLYLSPWGNCTKATVAATFNVPERSCAALYALYDPGIKSAGEEAKVTDDGFSFNYRVEYQGSLARLNVVLPVGEDGAMSGIGRSSWSEL